MDAKIRTDRFYVWIIPEGGNIYSLIKNIEDFISENKINAEIFFRGGYYFYLFFPDGNALEHIDEIINLIDGLKH